MKCKSGVYQIKNITNGKVYIGNSENIKRRWGDHKKRLRAQIHHCQSLQRAFNKYGESAFEYSIIEYVQVINQLADREQYWMDKIRPYKKKNGYNIRKIATSNLGISRAKGEKTGRAILTNKQVVEIRRRLINGEHYHHFADEYGVSTSAISAIKRGISWTHVPELLDEVKSISRNSGTRNNNGSNNPRSKLSIEDTIHIKYLLSQKYQLQEIAKIYNVPKQTIWKIKHNKHWTTKVLASDD